MINWPGVIKHADDAELVYIRDQSEWENNSEIHNFEYDEFDCLIDSTGKLYSLDKRINSCVKPEPLGHSMSLNDILGLVKAHASQMDSCCVAKLYAPTIAEAFAIVASLVET